VVQTPGLCDGEQDQKNSTEQGPRALTCTARAKKYKGNEGYAKQAEWIEKAGRSDLDSPSCW